MGFQSHEGSSLGSHNTDHPVSPPNVRYLTRGIFEVAYEAVSRPWFSFPPSPNLIAYRKPFHSLLRFLKDLWRISQWHCIEYYTCTLWLAVAPALSLFLASLVVFNVELLFQAGIETKDIMHEIKVQVVVWLFCGLITCLIESTMTELRLKIGGALRAHFIPQLVQASLEWDINHLDESYGLFPYRHDYGDFIPGWEFLEGTFNRLRHIVVILLEVLVMIHVIFLFNESLNINILTALMVLFFSTTLLSPTNGAGSGGYTFWTKNADYNRLMVVFSIVFDYQYRLTLVKDGLVDYFIEEYKRVSASLGVVEADTWVLGWGLPPPWYWSLPQFWLLNEPMALCALAIPWANSGSIISAMVILQYVIFTMHRSIEVLRCSSSNFTFMKILAKVDRFYQLLDEPSLRGFPNQPIKLDTRGTKITLTNVSYTYPSSGDPAVDSVNLTIEPGQLIVISGTNGSGKTTLLNLISGLSQPTQGHVLIDDVKLPKYGINELRRTMAFVSQSEAIYPMSLRENLLLGLPNASDRNVITEADLDDAACLGGSSHLMKQHGYDAVLNPCSVVCYSIRERPGRAAIDALERNTPNPRVIPISSGEHQRLIASRAFLRLKHGNIKLIILDEPSNSLDTIAEQQIFENFVDIARRNGQTIVLVTHRLASVVRHADLILSMNKGKIDEQGTHDDLIASGGRYSTFYKAQAFIE